jgi:hypothetical protein
VGESAVVLKQKNRLGGEGGAGGGPIDAIRQVDVEIGDHRPSLLRHVRLRRKVGLLDVLQLADQCLLR